MSMISPERSVGATPRRKEIQPFQPFSSLVRVDIAARSHAGLVRPNNEDHFFVTKLSRALETIVRTPPTTPGGPETVRDIAGQIGAPVGFFADWAGSPDLSHN